MCKDDVCVEQVSFAFKLSRTETRVASRACALANRVLAVLPYGQCVVCVCMLIWAFVVGIYWRIFVVSASSWSKHAINVQIHILYRLL